MRQCLWFVVAVWVILVPSVHAEDRVEGRVVVYDSDNGIKNVEVRLLNLGRRELDRATTDSNGEFELRHSEELTRFNLRYDPVGEASNEYYVGARTRIERSGGEMDVDTVGLVEKGSTDMAAAGKQQRDAARYLRTGGSRENVRREVELARRRFGNAYEEALRQQPSWRRSLESLGVQLR